MGFKKNNPGCNCCGCSTECEIFTTAFTGGDSSDISQGDSGGFVASSGTWDITSNQLRCTAAGIALLNTPQPCDSIAMVVTVTFKHSSATASVDVIFGAISATDYWYVRSDFSADTVSIRRNNGGSHSTIKTVAFQIYNNDGTEYTIGVCVTPGGNVTVKRGVEYILTAFAQPITGTGCGLATSAGTATFDNFSFYQSERSAGDGCEQCKSVPSTCADCCGTTTTEFIVDWPTSFSSITCDGICETLSAGEYTLTGSGGSCQWSYNDLGPGYDCSCTDGQALQERCGASTGDPNDKPVLCFDLRALVNTILNPDRCYLRLRVHVLTQPDTGGCNDRELIAANYESDAALASFDACTGDDITLYLVDPAGTIASSYRNTTGWFDQYSGGCTGTLPATITVRAA